MQVSWREKISNLIFYPFTFAIWIVLGSYAYMAQTGELEFQDVLRSFVLTPLLVLLAWVLLTGVWKNPQKSAFYVWFTLALSFTYQFQYQKLKGYFPFLGDEVLTVTPLALWGIFFGIAEWRKYYEGRFTVVFEGAGVGLLIFTGFTLFWNQDSVSSSYQVGNVAEAASTRKIGVGIEESRQPRGELPDIYYIILDGYARNDVLKKDYDFNNQPFLDELTKRGFYVATQSRSNYAQTTLSLSSSLNFRYLHDLPERYGRYSDNKTPLRELIHQNRLVTTLKEEGYKITAFSSGISFTELRDADTYIVPPYALNEWESGLIAQTPIPLLTRAFSHDLLFDLHKRRIEYSFDRLPTVVKSDVPHFVFLHVVTPHPPFVLGNQEALGGMEYPFTFRDASHYKRHYRVSSANYISRYKEQLQALNLIVLESLDRLLSHSDRAPLIIIQADHGPGAHVDWQNLGNTSLHERMSILNALYVPDGVNIGFYQDMTPVNTFRIILNHYFHENLPLLKDESYFSPMAQPYNFIPVTDQLTAS